MIRAILFDLDGTVLNTLGTITAAGNDALIRLGYPSLSEEIYLSYVGNGKKELIKRMLNADAENPTLVHQVESIFDEYYKKNPYQETKPYDGIIELLQTLKERNILRIIITNKDDSAAQMVIRRFFPNCFDLVVGIRAGIHPKPNPSTVQKVLQHFQLQPEECIFVGDMEPDVQVAKNANIKSCAVCWGFTKEKILENYQPDYLIHHPSELIKVIEENH